MNKANIINQLQEDFIEKFAMYVEYGESDFDYIWQESPLDVLEFLEFVFKQGVHFGHLESMIKVKD